LTIPPIVKVTDKFIISELIKQLLSIKVLEELDKEQVLVENEAESKEGEEKVMVGGN
jgi:hypothetical protein